MMEQITKIALPKANIKETIVLSFDAIVKIDIIIEDYNNFLNNRNSFNCIISDINRNYIMENYISNDEYLNLMKNNTNVILKNNDKIKAIKNLKDLTILALNKEDLLIK